MLVQFFSFAVKLLVYSFIQLLLMQLLLCKYGMTVADLDNPSQALGENYTKSPWRNASGSGEAVI